jgi:hypothetical protein
MAKEPGLGDNFYIGGRDISGDTNSVGTIRSARPPINVTGIDKSAHERIPGQWDGEVSFTAYFNDASDQAFDVLKAVPTANTQVMYFRGTALGDQGACMVGNQASGGGPERTADGGMTFDAQFLSDGKGLEWTRNLTAGKRTDGSATDGSSVDDGVAGSSSFGLSAYLQVFAFTGTSVTCTIEESSNDGAGDAFAAVTGGAFAAVSGANEVQRIQTSLTQTVERYLRLATTGTFSDAVFAVMYVRYLVTPGLAI